MRLYKRITLVLAGSLLTPLIAHADSWSCRLGNDVREVHTEQTTPGPCTVSGCLQKTYGRL